MELSPQTLRDVTFGQKRSGYDPADVDDFIDQVAEGVEDLNRKLAEAQARASGSGVPAPAMSASDIGKVWERAAAAAESAVEEARQEASRILEEARSNAAAAEAAVEDARAEATRLREDARQAARQESDQLLQAARSDADAIKGNARAEAEQNINSARSEAEQTINHARGEAARFEQESQDQLRADLEQLESARNELRGQVDALGSYLDGELTKVRNVLTSALNDLDAADTSAPAPYTPDVNVTGQRFQGSFADAAPYTPPAFTPAPDFSAPAPAPEDNYANYVESAQQTSFDEPELTQEPAPWDQPAASTEPAPWDRPAEDVAPWERQDEQSAAQNAADDEDDDVDPFLAELRRAVHDDSPLGPRDDNDDASINGLYSDDEEDKGFFRRKR